MLEHRRDYDARGLSHVECGAEEDIRERLALAAAPVTDAGLREIDPERLNEAATRAGVDMVRLQHDDIRLWTQDGAEAGDIASEYAALSRQAEKETA
jgi:hypothetical protein